MKLKTDTNMTNSTLARRDSSISTSYVLNFIGLIAGATVALASLVTLSPIGFFTGLAGAMFCLDGVRQS